MKGLIFDCETDGFVADLTRIHCIAYQEIGGDGLVRSVGGLTDEKVRGFLSHLEEAPELWGHNILKFDLAAIQKVYPTFRPKGLMRDTEVISHLIWPEMKQNDFNFMRKNPNFPGKLIGRHSLKAWGYRLGVLKGTFKEEEGGPDSDRWAKWSQEMEDYCRQDVVVTSKLRDLILSKKYSEEAIQLEHDFKRTIILQEHVGFPFDVAAASHLYGELGARRSMLEKKLQILFPPIQHEDTFIPKVNSTKFGYQKGVPFIKRHTETFKPTSEDHIVSRLKATRGWEPKKFGKLDGKAAFDDDVMSGLKVGGKNVDGWVEVDYISEYRDVNKIIAMLAEGKNAWLKLEKNGRIHGGVNTNGAVTGRCTHMKPNMGQIPKEGELGHACRQLFHADGRVLVGADASGLELRMLAHFMGKFDGGSYAKVVTEGDVHTVNQQAAGLPTRANAKTFIYGFLYGAGDGKIGSIVGKGSAEGKVLRARFLKGLPALKRLKDMVQEAIRQRGYLVGLDGRHLNIRSPHSALNTLLQSAGAICVKKATVLFHQEMARQGLLGEEGKEYFLGSLFLPICFRYREVPAMVAHVHDEVQVITTKGTEGQVGQLFIDAIRKTGEHFKLRCPLDGTAKSGRTWADTH